MNSDSTAPVSSASKIGPVLFRAMMEICARVDIPSIRRHCQRCDSRQLGLSRLSASFTSTLGFDDSQHLACAESLNLRHRNANLVFPKLATPEDIYNKREVAILRDKNPSGHNTRVDVL